MVTSKQKTEKTIDNLEHKKKMALAIIGLSMKDEIILHIVGITDLVIMWQTLKRPLLKRIWSNKF
jgi:hypothetical protein